MEKGNGLRDTAHHLIDENKFFHGVYFAYRKIKFTYQGSVINLRRSLRSHGIAADKYNKLRSYENIHKGKRCFIIATGPSLTMEDLESLKGEYTISMNSICKLYDETDWRPTYYAVQDNMVFNNMQDTLRKHPEVPVFISDNIFKRYKREKSWIEFPTDAIYHAYDKRLNKYYAKFSGDAYDIVYDGYSIAYSCIELAVYMGFTEIYLLGADCTYLGEKEHFVDSGVVDRHRPTYTPMLIVGYEKAKEYADTHGIKIYNSTRGGVLEVFERKPLEEVLNK